MSVSHATRAIVSGWPSVTDSDVNRYRFATSSLQGMLRRAGRQCPPKGSRAGNSGQLDAGHRVSPPLGLPAAAGSTLFDFAACPRQPGLDPVEQPAGDLVL